MTDRIVRDPHPGIVDRITESLFALSATPVPGRDRPATRNRTRTRGLMNRMPRGPGLFSSTCVTASTWSPTPARLTEELERKGGAACLPSSAAPPRISTSQQE
jgi:hypothetical protein